jgi:hypothetical protein
MSSTRNTPRRGPGRGAAAALTVAGLALAGAGLIAQAASAATTTYRRLGRRTRLVSVLAVAAGGLLGPLAAAAPAYAQTVPTICLFEPTSSSTPYGLPTELQLDVAAIGEPGIPTGTATFSVGTTTLGTVQVSGGVAVQDFTFGAAGTNPVTATYSGDANFASCTATGTEIVTQDRTSTTVASSLNPSAAGQQVTFTATVTATPGVNPDLTGLVTFFDATTTLGTGTLNSSGRASITTSVLAPGSHRITASYGGDMNDTGSTSAALTQTVTADDNDLTISTPADVTVDAAGPSGAAVSYPLPVVSDPDDATAPTPACSPASGTTFAIGVTAVTCTATDPDDSPSMVSTSFTVTVAGAAAQLASLDQAVNGVGPGSSLADKTTAAQSYLASGDTADACSTLTGFIQEVRAQNGKSIPAGQAAQRTADATRIQAVLAC